MMAITWIREFVSLAGVAMLPFTSGILTAVLPRYLDIMEDDPESM